MPTGQMVHYSILQSFNVFKTANNFFSVQRQVKFFTISILNLYLHSTLIVEIPIHSYGWI